MNDWIKVKNTSGQDAFKTICYTMKKYLSGFLSLTDAQSTFEQSLNQKPLK